MDEREVIDQITGMGGVDVVEAEGDHYFFYDPQNDQPVDHRFPFATLVTGDRHDQASDLDRESVYRLNIGLERTAYEAMFGTRPSWPKDGFVVETGHNYTLLDRLMPHPVYSPQSWICVLNPSEGTFESLRPLLTAAYERAARSHRKRSG